MKCPNGMSQSTESASEEPNGQPDREAIKALYLLGWSPQDLAQKYALPVGRIHKWVVRGKWAVIRSETRQIASGRAGDGQASQERSEKLRAGIALEMLKDLEVIQRHPPRNMKQAKEREEILQTMTKNGEVIHPDWAARTSTTVLRIEHLTALQSAVRINPNQPQLPNTPVHGQTDTTPVSQGEGPQAGTAPIEVEGRQ